MIKLWQANIIIHCLTINHQTGKTSTPMSCDCIKHQPMSKVPIKERKLRNNQVDIQKFIMLVVKILSTFANQIRSSNIKKSRRFCELIEMTF